MYKIPDEYFFKLHHVRPRFKNDYDGVLIHMANLASGIRRENSDKFDQLMISGIRQYGENATKSDKTIQNWRTEISSLFGLFIDAGNGQKYASDNAIMLSESEDSVEFFKYFLYTFQYPGGHQKSRDVAEIIKQKIKFKPTRYILEVLRSEKSAYITKAEATHCIFNDLRITRDRQDPNITYQKIIKNRKNMTEYDWCGDIIRYAGDILDYMVLANLLKKNGNNFSLIQSEKLSIDYFIRNDPWFDGYECLYHHTEISATDTEKIRKNWFLYVNIFANKVDFKTNILQYINYDPKTYSTLVQDTLQNSKGHWQFQQEPIQNNVECQNFNPTTTKQIGDYGEALIIGHERMRLKKNDHLSFLKKVVFIPNQFGIGFDIRSYDPENIKKIINIEVKTTISNSENTFRSFHMTDNEWNVAGNIMGQYHVYRLQLRKEENNVIHPRLCIIKNPVQLYKENILHVELSNGANVSWNEKIGEEVELLQWVN